MKRKILTFGSLLIVGIVLSFLWDKYWSVSHEPIDIESVESISLAVYGKHPSSLTEVPKDEYIKFIEWFNQYDSKK